MYKRIPVYLLCLLFLVAPAFVSAQFGTNSSTVSLSTDPTFPEPGETFTAKVSTYNLDAPRSKITWFVDGAERSADVNEESISVEAKDTKTVVTARVTLANGKTEEVSKTILPTRIDLIIGADTVVPNFYKGRKLASNGSPLTATALIFKENVQTSNAYTYLWEVNGKVQHGGAVYGKNTLTYTPSFDDEVLISVKVFANDNSLVAQEAHYIPVVRPELYFYEQNPLKGLLNVALRNPHIFIGEEITIRAEGYYMNKNLTGTNVLREWEIDGRKVDANEDPQEITLQKEGEGGETTLSFHLRNLSQLLQGVEKTIDIQF